MNAKIGKTRQAEAGERPDKTSATAKSNGCYAKKAPSRANHLQGHEVQPGQVLNPHGRPKGSRNRLSEKFLESLEQLWEERGREILDRAVEESPATLIAAITKLIPKEATLSIHGGVQLDLTVEQRQRIAQSWIVSQGVRNAEAALPVRALPKDVPVPDNAPVPA